MSGYIGNIPVPQATQTRQSFTATASQTTFNTAGYTAGFIDVFLNGIKLVDGTDYTATNGSDVVLTTGAALDDVLDVVAYTAFDVANSTLTDATINNTLTLKNATEEDTDGGRESKITFKGEQSGGEITTLAQIQASHDGTSDDEKGDLIFSTNDGSDGNTPTEAMRIDANQNVGIGTSSPSSYNSNIDDLVVYNAASGGITIATGTSSQGAIAFADGTGGGDPLRGRIRYDHSNNSMGFRVNNDEKMSIDASGNLLVGKTATDINTQGAELKENGTILATSSGDKALDLNRKSSNGEMIKFRKDGSSVGSIRYENRLVIAGAIVGLYFGGGDILPTDSAGAQNDNAVDLGSSSIRWDDVYATNGTIQTSDQNEKQQIAALTDAEMTAAKAISKLFKTFKWNDSVAEKGDAARTHSGVIAQEVEQAMTDAGLNAGNYAFFISTTWWEADGDTYDTAEEAPEGATERNRKGIRYPQLLSFIGAATEQRLASIESRLDALENPA